MTEIRITFDGAGAAQEGADAPSAGAAASTAGPPRCAGERVPASDAPAAPGAASTGAPDGAGATSTGARAPGEDAHAQITNELDDAAEIEGDLAQLVKKAKQRDEYLALAQRTQADFENYRKRVAKEAAAAQERGAIALAKELLPALDNLDRALEAAADDDPLLQGVRLVRSELAAALARVGIESFSPHGEQFDPAVHEAVATAPQDGEDGMPSGTVVEVYQPGYRCRESVIRPARVVVAA